MTLALAADITAGIETAAEPPGKPDTAASRPLRSTGAGLRAPPEQPGRADITRALRSITGGDSAGTARCDAVARRATLKSLAEPDEEGSEARDRRAGAREGPGSIRRRNHVTPPSH